MLSLGKGVNGAAVTRGIWCGLRGQDPVGVMGQRLHTREDGADLQQEGVQPPDAWHQGHRSEELGVSRVTPAVVGHWLLLYRRLRASVGGRGAQGAWVC